MSVRTVFLALVMAGVFAAVTRANTIEPVWGRVAAIAYSPATGQYGYAYNYRSKSEAEKTALADCGADDARIVCWVKDGFCALALGDDKAWWGVGWQYGSGAGTEEAKKAALENCQSKTTGAHIVLVLSSDGQFVWDRKKSVVVTHTSGKDISPSATVSPPPHKAVPSKNDDGSVVEALPKEKGADGENKK